MKVITALESYIPAHNDVLVFLAGGITGCENWQRKVIETLSQYENTEHLVLLNPRRDNFPMGDPEASRKQIEWEFQWLERCDIFSIYFAGGDSIQPICMYELGRNLVRMQMKHPLDWDDRLVINVAPDYIRKFDIVQQVVLARSAMYNAGGVDAISHASMIDAAYRRFINVNFMED